MIVTKKPMEGRRKKAIEQALPGKVIEQPQKKVLENFPREISKGLPKTSPPITPPLTSIREDTLDLEIEGETYSKEYPPQVELTCQPMNKVDTGLGFETHQSFITLNNFCQTCKGKDIHSSLSLIFPCKHWIHMKCSKGVACPICKPSGRPIELGQSKQYSEFLMNESGSVGRAVPINSGSSSNKMKEFLETYGPDKKLNFKGRTEEFLENSNLSIDNYSERGKNIIDFINLTGVKSRFEMEKKGLGYKHICNKEFMVSTDIMLRYGIDRTFIMSKKSHWEIPTIRLEGGKYICPHPIELMHRRGFRKEDFIKLGWDKKVKFFEDGTSKDLADFVFS